MDAQVPTSDDRCSDYNAFWSRYVQARSVGARDHHTPHVRLVRDGNVSHASLGWTRDAVEEDEDTTAVVEPSPFDYIAAVLQRDSSAPHAGGKSPSRTPPRWDVTAAKSALWEAAKSLSSSPQGLWDGSSGGISSSRRGASDSRHVTEDEHSGSTRRLSPMSTGLDLVSRADVPRQLFSPQECVTPAQPPGIQEINLSDVSVAMSSDCDASETEEERGVTSLARSRASLTTPEAPPQASVPSAWRSPVFDVNAAILSRHATALPPTKRDARKEDTEHLASDEVTRLRHMYGDRLRPDEWRNAELVAFLAHQEARTAAHEALNSAAPTSSTTPVMGVFRHVYRASHRPRGAEPTGSKTQPRAPAVFVARPATHGTVPATAPSSRVAESTHALTPSATPSRFIEWVAHDVDMYLDLVLDDGR